MDNNQLLRLYKYSEHGFGKHILVIKSEYYHDPKPFLKAHLDSRWKVHYISLDLNEDQSIASQKMINTFNHYSYIKNFIFDYTSFLFFLKNIERIHATYATLDNIIVLDPVTFTHEEHSLLPFITETKRNSHKSFLNEEIEIPGHLTSDLLVKSNYMRPQAVKIASITDKKFGLKLSSILRNSLFEPVKDIDHSFRVIKRHFQ
jgi:hypothetical protein